mgnify:FL=1
MRDTETAQLGSYQDVAPVSSSSTASAVFQSPHAGFNMERYTMNESLAREFIVGQFAWGTEAEGVVIGKLDFPGDLFSQDYIADKIDDFRYFRAGVRISIRVTANRYMYGKLLVAYNPIPSLDAYDNATVRQPMHIASGRPHVLVSASSNDVVTFDVPYISPNRALDLLDYVADEIGHFVFYVMNPLTSTNGVNDGARVIVTARFLEPEIYLPHDFNVQSKSEGSLKSAMQSIGNDLIKHVPKRGVVKYAKSVGRTVLRETISGMKSSVASMAVGAIMGLSKPGTLDLAGVGKINPYSDIPSGQGISTDIKLAMDPENGISTEPNVGGVSTDEMNLNYIAGTPSLTRITNFVKGSAPIAVAVCTPYDTYQTYVDILCKNFLFASGSYKFKMYITASVFHAVRLVFWLSEDSDPVTNWEECYHRIVEVQGDTEVEFSVPYLQKGFTSTTSVGIKPFSIYCAILAWSQPDDLISNPIYINTYKSGDNDFRFGAQAEVTWTLQSNPRLDFEREFQPFHPSFTSYMQEGLLFGEDFDTLRQLMHRNYATSSTSTGKLNMWNIPSSPVLYGPEKFGALFRFYRGSVRWKIYPKSGNIQTLAACLQIGTTNLQGYTMSSGTNPVIEVEAPYYNDATFKSTDFTDSNYKLLFSDPSGENVFASKSLGDDFSFHFMRLTDVLIQNAFGSGQDGIITWFSTAT